MAEELPSGDFLLTYKITTMGEKIFIVTRQNFYSSRGVYYAMPMSNPVVGAWRSKAMIDEFFERRTKQFIEQGCTYEHVKELNSLGLIERYTIKDRDGEIACIYSVIVEFLL